MTPWPGPTMVTLIDDELVWSDATEWRDECFARELISGPPGRRARILAELQTDKPEYWAKLHETIAKIEGQG